MATRPSPVTVLAGAAAAGLAVAAVLTVGSTAPSAAPDRVVPVARGVVQSTVSGTGSLEPANQTTLNFATSGQISRIAVTAGQHVHRGQVLATLDPAAARVALAQAQAALSSAEDALAKASTPVTTTTPASSSPSSSSPGRGGSSSAPAAKPTTTTTQPSATSVAAAQANVDSANLQVQQAEGDLAATTLRAPMPATVASVSGAVGDNAGGNAGSGSATSQSSSSASGLITLAQLSSYKLQVGLSESDVGKVKVGQPATVTIDAVAGEEFAAHVTSIGVLPTSSSSSSPTAAGNTSSGAVSYPVTLTLDQTSGKLRAGMSASANIVTSEASGLTVPNQALTGSSVTLVRGGSRLTQAVQIGLQGDSSTEILGGLKTGDQVVIRSPSAAAGASATSTPQPGGAFGAGGVGRGFGGGGFGGGGFRGGGGIGRGGFGAGGG